MHRIKNFINSYKAKFIVVPAGNKSMKQLGFNFLVIFTILIALIGVNLYLIISTVHSNSVAKALDQSNTILSEDLLKEKDRIASLESIERHSKIQVKALQEKLAEAAIVVEKRLRNIEKTEVKLNELVKIFNEQTGSNLKLDVSRSFVREISDKSLKMEFGMGNTETNIVEIAKVLSTSNEIADTLSEKSESVSSLKKSLTDQLSYLAARPDYYPTSGYFSSPFGMRIDPISNVESMHYGIDIANSINTNIYAAGDGVVLFVGTRPMSGNVVIITHGYGFTTVYAHCNSFAVEEGQKIKKGDLIAYMGNTGYSTGPHLHFEIRYNGTPIDPLTILNQK